MLSYLYKRETRSLDKIVLYILTWVKMTRLINYFFTLFYFSFWVLKLKKRERLIIAYESMGDTCYALSFNRFLQKKYICYFIVSEKQKKMIELSYSQIPSRKLLFYENDSFKRRIVLTLMQSHLLSSLFSKHKVWVMYPTVYSKMSERIIKDFRGIIAEKILQVETSEGITYPNYPKIKINKIKEWDLIRGKVIVCNPYSTSMDINPMFWEKLAELLIEKGYIVYTNIIQGQEAIKGTRPLDCSIFEMATICNGIPLMVSIRSGIIDYVINTTCNKFIIYNNLDQQDQKNQNMFSIYNLDSWQKDNICQYRMDSYDSAFNRIKEYLTEISKNQQVL